MKGRAPGHLRVLLLNQFYKNILEFEFPAFDFLANQRRGPAGQLCSLPTLIDRHSCMTHSP